MQSLGGSFGVVLGTWGFLPFKTTKTETDSLKISGFLHEVFCFFFYLSWWLLLQEKSHMLNAQKTCLTAIYCLLPFLFKKSHGNPQKMMTSLALYLEVPIICPEPMNIPPLNYRNISLPGFSLFWRWFSFHPLPQHGTCWSKPPSAGFAPQEKIACTDFTAVGWDEFLGTPGGVSWWESGSWKVFEVKKQRWSWWTGCTLLQENMWPWAGWALES